MTEERWPEMRAALAAAERPVFFTGAGMSADSGIPTFRGPGGMWRGSRPEELATPEAFARDPQKVTDWYRMRRGVIAGADPHAGHRALAAYTQSREGAIVVTQNVDGLHQRAGCPRVEELHGSIWIDRCSRCSQEVVRASTDPIPEEGSDLPRCSCGSLQRPGVVWFGESLDPGTIERSVAALQRADAVVVVGTSSVVQPAASLVDLAPPDALRIEVNPDPGRPDGEHCLGTAAEVLPALLGGS